MRVAPGGPSRSCVGCSRAVFAPLSPRLLGCDLGVWLQSLQYLAFPCPAAALSAPAGSAKNPFPTPRSASFCCLSCTPCKKKQRVCVCARSKCGLPAPLSRAGASRDEARGARGCQKTPCRLGDSRGIGDTARHGGTGASGAARPQRAPCGLRDTGVAGGNRTPPRHGAEPPAAGCRVSALPFAAFFFLLLLCAENNPGGAGRARPQISLP